MEGRRRRPDVSGYRIHPFAPSDPRSCISPSLSLPADRTSGQSEITLSPSRCVQSKLQFKSSCQTLFSPVLSLSLSPSTRHRRLCRSRSLFRQLELEIPKIVLHRPPTNSAVPHAHARTREPFPSNARLYTLWMYVYARTDRARVRERASFCTAGLRGRSRNSLRLAVTSRPHYWRIPLHDRLLRGERASRGKLPDSCPRRAAWELAVTFSTN